MLLVPQDRRRTVLIRALEIAIGAYDGKASNDALKDWAALTLAFNRMDKLEARQLLQHLQSGAVLVVSLRDGPQVSDREPDQAA